MYVSYLQGEYLQQHMVLPSPGYCPTCKVCEGEEINNSVNL